VDNKEFIFILTNSYDTLVRTAGIATGRLEGAELIKNAKFEVRSL
jgi:hypothetical protein